MSSHQNSFEPQPLDSNPFDEQEPTTSSSSNPFSHANDSAFSLDSQDTERGLGGTPPPQKSFGYGFNQSTKSGAPPTLEEIRAKEAALAKRQAEINADFTRREASLTQRERDLGILRNNWPPYFPFVHHDIGTLPDQHRTVTKLLYTQWLALAVTLIVNLLGCIFLLIAGASEGGADVAAAGGYLPIIGIASFIGWYRPIYLGFSRTEGKAMAFFFYLYFLFAGFHLLFSIYMVIGIPSTGSAGLINTISSFASSHILAGVFGVLASAGWILQAAGGSILYKRVWDYKNGHGDINFQEATNQFKASSIRTIVLHQSRM